MCANPHPFATTKLADWRVKSLIAEVDRQRLVRLTRQGARRPVELADRTTSKAEAGLSPERMRLGCARDSGANFALAACERERA